MEWFDLLRVGSAGHGRFWSGEVGIGLLMRILGADSAGKSDGGIFECKDNCWRLLRKIINANGCGR